MVLYFEECGAPSSFLTFISYVALSLIISFFIHSSPAFILTSLSAVNTLPSLAHFNKTGNL